MEDLSSDSKSMIAAFNAKKFEETGRPGMVVYVMTPTDDPEVDRRDLFYFTVDEIAALLKDAQATNQEREAFVLVVNAGRISTRVLPREVSH